MSDHRAVRMQDAIQPTAVDTCAAADDIARREPDGNRTEEFNIANDRATLWNKLYGIILAVLEY